MKANYPCDMHTHTTNSDGNETYYELIARAASFGIKAVAIADHDVLPLKMAALPGGQEVPAETLARGLGVCLFRAIEFSCETQVEDVHIIAMGCDWEHPALLKQAESIEKSKATAYAETVERLNKKGYAMSMREVLESAGVSIKEVQKKHIFNLMAAKGYAKDWSQAKLLVRDDPSLSVKREKPGALDILSLIHRAGGVAILAHPYLINEEIVFEGRPCKRRQFLDRLMDNGLDGIEVRYTYGKTTCQDKRPLEEIWEEVRSIAKGRVFLSGGSDYHADWKKGLQNPRELGECGLTMEEFLRIGFFKAKYEEMMDQPR